jgi:hypothetical protein
MNFYENPLFWITISLLAIVAIASIRFGFYLGMAAEAKYWTEKAYKEFKDNYFDSFVEKFEKRVSERSDELAAEKIATFIDNLPEEQQQWFMGITDGNTNDTQAST